MLLEVKGITFSYHRKKTLDNINFTLREGEILAVLGANGSGKSTLLKILLGYLKAQGEIFIDKKNITSYAAKDLAKKISYIPQTHSLPFAYTVNELVLMGRLPHTNFFSRYSNEDKRIAHAAMEKTGIAHLQNRSAAQISGGERQLTFIARALAQEARLLLMDEPVSGLDFANQVKLLKLLKNLKSEGYTLIKTTHFPEHALSISDKVALLKEGKLMDWGATDKKLTRKSIQKLYGIDVDMTVHKSGYKSCVPKI